MYKYNSNCTKLTIFKSHLAGLASVDPIMYPRGLLPTDLAGGQEKGETLRQVLVPLLTQPLADLAFDLVFVDRRPRVLWHVGSSPEANDVKYCKYNSVCHLADLENLRQSYQHQVISLGNYTYVDFIYL